MSLTKLLKIILSGILFALCLSPCFAQTATISDLWFMRGKWNAALGANSSVQEQWEKKDDHTLAGSSVFMESLVPATRESLKIIQTKDGLVLRIQHFNKDGKPWEESKETGDMKLVEYDLTHAVFDNQRQNERVRITYRWIEENQMSARVEVSQAKNPKVLEFHYHREIESGKSNESDKSNESNWIEDDGILEKAKLRKRS